MKKPKQYLELRKALQKADNLAFGRRLWWLREYVLNALEELDRIETGPENSREEVSPMGRSPQRDCKPFHDLAFTDPALYNQFI